MTTKVITATPSTPYKRLVELLATHRIGGVPVIDEDSRVLGVVSEADLLLKQEYPRDHEPGLGERLRHRADQARSHGTVAREFMRSPAITVGEDATVGQAARLMDARHVKRLPVADQQGRLVGIASRADLLRVFLRSDEEIRAEVRSSPLAGAGARAIGPPAEGTSAHQRRPPLDRWRTGHSTPDWLWWL